MSSERDEKRSSVTRQRAQSAVLGIVLLIGIVAIGSVSIYVVADTSVEQAQRTAEQERVEQSFAEFSQSVATASVDDLSSRSMTFEERRYGTLSKTDAGTITVEYNNTTDEMSLGAIEYESADGSVVAYQGGGVWRDQGTDTRMVSAPPIHYRDGTLTLPVTSIDGQEHLGTGEITASHNDTTSSATRVVEDETVRLTIQSDYYRGWAAYFGTQAGAAVVEEVDDENRTVEVLLGHWELHSAFDQGMMISDRYDQSGSPSLDGDDYVYGYMPELDDVVETMVEEYEANATDEGTVDGGTLTDGKYFADEVDLTDDDLTVDASDGNVTLVVDGDTTIDDNNLTVETDGKDHEFRLYTTGDVNVSSADVCVDGCPTNASEANASKLQVYGTSDSLVTLGPGDTTFEGTIYVASDDEFDTKREPNQCSAQVCITSDVDFYGAIVASSVEVTGGQGSITYEYDGDLEFMDEIYPEEYSLPPQIHYLNVAEHEIDIE